MQNTTSKANYWTVPAESDLASSTYYDLAPSYSGTASEDSEYEDEAESIRPPIRKHKKSKVATNLVIFTRASTSKAAKTREQLSCDSIDIPTPSQAAIYKSTFNEAAKLKEEIIEKLQVKQWPLHFDGKHIEKNEYQVMILKNERTEVKVEILHLKDGKVETIADGIAKVLDEYNLWNAIKMIVADTTGVNIGKKSGVVKLQRMFSEKVFSKPQFISCQHHVLNFQKMSMDKVCRFISYYWADFWFTNQMYNENDSKSLAEILKHHKKALKSLENH